MAFSADNGGAGLSDNLYFFVERANAGAPPFSLQPRTPNLVSALDNRLLIGVV